jgi:hypothetical protein
MIKLGDEWALNVATHPSCFGNQTTAFRLVEEAFYQRLSVAELLACIRVIESLFKVIGWKIRADWLKR